MAEGLLLFCYFPNTSQSANADSSPQGEPPPCLPWRGGAAKGGGGVGFRPGAQIAQETRKVIEFL